MNLDKVNLGTQTVSKLREYIADQKLEEGDRLPTEAQLTEILGVGRSTVREAVKILTYSGLIKVRQGSGMYVSGSSLSSDDADKLRAVQKMIEYEAVRELVENDIEANEWITLKAILGRRNQLLEQGKFTDYINADIDFHTAMVNMAHNYFLTKWYAELSTSWRVHLSNSVVKADDYDGNTALHNQLYDCLIERDGAAAVEILGKLGK